MGKKNGDRKRRARDLQKRQEKAAKTSSIPTTNVTIQTGEVVVVKPEFSTNAVAAVADKTVSPMEEDTSNNDNDSGTSTALPILAEPIVEQLDVVKILEQPDVVKILEQPAANIVEEPEVKIVEQPGVVKIVSESTLMNTILKDGSGLDLWKLHEGGNFFQNKSGLTNRNIMLFCERGSTHMSSFSLAQDHLNAIGKVDFVGDAECFKKLFRSTTNNDAMSFLVHRVGTSLLIDDFDLSALLWHKPEITGYNHSSALIDLVHHCIPDEERKAASFGWRTLEIATNKNAMHHFFYACMNGQEPKIKDSESAVQKLNSGKPNGFDEQPTADLRGSNTKFLNTYLWEFGHRKFVIGSNVPTFMYESDYDEDEPFINCLTTLGIHSPDTSNDENLSEWSGIDMWFNNMSVGATQTYVCHQVDCKARHTEFIKTDDISKRAKFNDQLLFARFQSLLDGIYDSADRGHSYWMYRGPGSDSLKIHKITGLLHDKTPETLFWSNASLSHSDLALALKRTELTQAIGIVDGRHAAAVEKVDTSVTIKKRKKNISPSEEQILLANGTSKILSNSNRGQFAGLQMNGVNELQNSSKGFLHPDAAYKEALEGYKKVHILTGRVISENQEFPQASLERFPKNGHKPEKEEAGKPVPKGQRQRPREMGGGDGQHVSGRM